MTEDVLMQVKALDPAPGDLPEAMSSAAVVLQEIDERSTTVQTQEQQTDTGQPSPRRRGLLLAAAVAALVVLIGAVVIGLANRNGTDVVEPTPTTLTAPTTVPTPTTAPPATTVPATTAPPATEPAVVFEPQTYEASVTWDGETCDYQGPAAARAGDTLSMTFANDTELFAKVDVAYLTAGATVGDLRDHFGASFVQETGPRPSFLVSVDQFGSVANDGIFSGLVLFPGVVDTQDVLLKTPREHVFICSDNDTQQWDEEWRIGVAGPSLAVVEDSAALPELPPQAFDATLTWDGETCTFDGPTAARARDTLRLTMVNDTTRVASFLTMYVASGTTIEDVSSYFDVELGNSVTVDTPGWAFPGPDNNLRNTSPPSPFNLVDESGALLAGEAATLEILIRQPREHVFTCAGADDGNNQSDRFIDNAPQSITVTE